MYSSYGTRDEILMYQLWLYVLSIATEKQKDEKGRNTLFLYVKSIWCMIDKKVSESDAGGRWGWKLDRVNMVLQCVIV
jgi:hypothetical protein